MTDAAEQRMRSSVSSSDGSVGTGIDVCLACPSETVEKIEKQIIVKRERWDLLGRSELEGPTARGG
ncbi:hypothetical protein THAOC_21829, partial [Thalassiosira oceanica]